MWSYGTDFFGDGQPVLVAEFFGHSGGSVTDESGVVDLSFEADPIGDDVDMQVVGVFVRDGYPLMVIQPICLAKNKARRFSALNVIRGSSCGAMPISMRRNLFLQRLL